MIDKLVPSRNQPENTNHLQRLPAVTFGFIGSLLVANCLIASDVAASNTTIAQSETEQPELLSKQSGAISQAVSNALKGDSNLTADSLHRALLAQATITSESGVTQAAGSHSQTAQSLLRVRTDELMSVDIREVDELSARLKEIIGARYDVEKLNIESIGTIDALRAQLAELENLLQDASSQREALLNERLELTEKLSSAIGERDRALNDLSAVSDEIQGHLGSVQALTAETQSAAELISSKELALADMDTRLGDLRSQRESALARSNNLADQLADSQKTQDELTSRLNAVVIERDNALNSSEALETELNAGNDRLMELQALHETVSLEKEQAESTVLELQRGVGDSESSIASLESELNDKASAIEALEEQLSVLSEEKSKVLEKSLETDSLLNEQVDKSLDLESRIGSLEIEKTESLELIRQLQEQIAQAESMADSMLSEKSSLVSELSLFESKAVDVASSLAQEQQDHSQTKAVLAELQNEAHQLHGEIDKLTDERNELLDEKTNLVEAARELQGDHDALAAVLGTRKNELHLARKSQVQLETQMEALKEERDVASAAAESLNERVSSMVIDNQTLVNDYKARISNLEKDMADRELEIDATIAEKDRSINSLRENMAALQQEIAEKDAGIVELKARIDELESGRQLLSSTLKEGEMQLVRLNAEVSGLIAKQETSAGELTALRNKNQELRGQLKTADDELNAVNQRSAENIAHFEAEIKQLRATQSDLESASEQSSAKIRKLNEQLSSTQAEYAAAEDVLEDLKVNLLDYEGQLNDSNGQLRELRLQKELADAEREQTSSEAEGLRLTLASELQSAEVENVSVLSARADNSIPIRLGNADFFDPGSAKLTKRGAENLTKLGKVIKAYGDRRIVVEGHTDSVPIGLGLRAMYESNWELSVARAATAVRHLAAGNQIDPKQLTASGFGQYQPLASNDTEQGRQQNRRVEVVLYPVENQYETLSATEE